MDGHAPVQGSQIADFLDRKCDLLVPNDYPTASICVNEGRPLWEAAPKSALRAAFEQLAEATHELVRRAAPGGSGQEERRAPAACSGGNADGAA